MIIYIDTSALGRVYLGDESDSPELFGVVYDGIARWSPVS